MQDRAPGKFNHRHFTFFHPPPQLMPQTFLGFSPHMSVSGLAVVRRAGLLRIGVPSRKCFGRHHSRENSDGRIHCAAESRPVSRSRLLAPPPPGAAAPVREPCYRSRLCRSSYAGDPNLA